MSKQQAAILLLADGTLYNSKAFGKIGTTTGEICFNTGMTGYQEVFTDPSYYGQVVIMNNVHIGNYGVCENDIESSSVKVQGVIGRSLEQMYSRRQAHGSLDDYLKANDVVGIEDVDTRALVAHIRARGAMNCIISSETDDIEYLKARLSEAPDMGGLELASKVTTTVAYEVGDTTSPIKIAVMDFGVKNNILTCMIDRGAI